MLCLEDIYHKMFIFSVKLFCAIQCIVHSGTKNDDVLAPTICKLWEICVFFHQNPEEFTSNLFLNRNKHSKNFKQKHSLINQCLKVSLAFWWQFSGRNDSWIRIRITGMLIRIRNNWLLFYSKALKLLNFVICWYKWSFLLVSILPVF